MLLNIQNPPHMKRLSAFLPLALLAIFGVNAQYCSPSFENGCSLWHIMNVSVGSSFNWNFTDCADWDQTPTTIPVNSTDMVPMSVTSGIWCGSSVWVDWNNSSSFEESENLYHSYVGGDPSYTYNFNIVVPNGTPAGQYRMRIIGAWGSDGFTVGSQNGYGPCGNFLYGNFNDFTLEVSTPTSIADLANASTFSVSPNPTTGMVTLNLGQRNAQDMITVEGMDGRVVREVITTGTTVLNLDLSDLPAGMYFLRNTSDTSAHPARLVKQ